MQKTPDSAAARSLWQKLSLYGLRPAEQHLLKFLLLLPLAALIVSVYRTLIGVPTFGTFGPALLGLAFLDLQAVGWGLGIFVAVVLVGWAMRHLLEHFHLLQVPRTSALLTLIVMLLIVIVVAASQFGIAATHYVSLFPLVILTHLVERFWTLETEDSTAASFKTLFQTMLIATAIALVLSRASLVQLLFRYPELLGLVMAAQLLIGRYTGYRLMELLRFRDFLEPTVGQHPWAIDGDS